jgi:hypothetical protein
MRRTSLNNQLRTRSHHEEDGCQESQITNERNSKEKPRSASGLKNRSSARRHAKRRTNLRLPLTPPLPKKPDLEAGTRAGPSSCRLTRISANRGGTADTAPVNLRDSATPESLPSWKAAAAHDEQTSVPHAVRTTIFLRQKRNEKALVESW